MITLDLNSTYEIKDTDTQEILATGNMETKNSRLVGCEAVVEQARQIARVRNAKLAVTQFGGFSVIISEDYSPKLQAPKQRSQTVDADPRSWIVRR